MCRYCDKDWYRRIEDFKDAAGNYRTALPCIEYYRRIDAEIQRRINIERMLACKIINQDEAHKMLLGDSAF